MTDDRFSRTNVDDDGYGRSWMDAVITQYTQDTKRHLNENMRCLGWEDKKNLGEKYRDSFIPTLV